VRSPKSPDKDHPQNRSHNVEIRAMVLDDLPAVFHLGERLFTAEEVPNLHRTWDEYEVTDFFQHEPDLCLVAEQGDRLLGFVMGTTIDKRRSAWKYGHLVWLGVEPDHARHGLGERLFRQLRHRMEEDGVRMIIVDTEADNEAGLAFFRQLGFNHPHEHVYLSLNLSQPRRPPAPEPSGKGGEEPEPT
jgi:ribosomal protein S18 acetylase RimI-like enzyme